MTTCPDFEAISADVDGESPPEAAAALHAHVEGCDRCRRQRAQLLVLKAGIRGSVPDHHASEALRRKLEALAPASSPSSHRALARRALRWALPAAAALLVVVGGGIALSRWSRVGRESFESQLVGDHILNALNHEKPLHVVSDDPAVVEKWFQDNVDFGVSLPRLPGSRVTGGRLCVLGGRRAALTFVDVGDHRLSLFAMADGKAGAGPRCADGVQGFSVCRRSARGIEYALVGDLPGPELDRLLADGIAGRADPRDGHP